MTDYSATPFNLHSSDPAEAEQMAQAEIERLQKQVNDCILDINSSNINFVNI